MEWEGADAEFKALVQEVERADMPIAAKEKILRHIAQEQIVAGYDSPAWEPTLEKALACFRKMHEEARLEDHKVPEWNKDIEHAWLNNALVESFSLAGRRMIWPTSVRAVWDKGMRTVCFSVLARGDVELPAEATGYGQRATKLRESSRFVEMMGEGLPKHFAKHMRPAGGKEPPKRTVH